MNACDFYPADMGDLLFGFGCMVAFGFACGVRWAVRRERKRQRPRLGNMDLMRGYERDWDGR